MLSLTLFVIASKDVFIVASTTLLSSLIAYFMCMFSVHCKVVQDEYPGASMYLCTLFFFTQFLVNSKSKIKSYLLSLVDNEIAKILEKY